MTLAQRGRRFELVVSNFPHIFCCFTRRLAELFDDLLDEHRFHHAHKDAAVHEVRQGLLGAAAIFGLPKLAARDSDADPPREAST